MEGKSMYFRIDVLTSVLIIFVISLVICDKFLMECILELTF